MQCPKYTLGSKSRQLPHRNFVTHRVSIEQLPMLSTGMLIEVLWDIELQRCNGRREGERVIETRWWRAEILHCDKQADSNIGTLIYERSHGFDQQESRARVFSQYLQPLDDN